LTKAEDTSRFEKQRKEKLTRLRELGIDPYGSRYDNTQAAKDIKSDFIEDDENQHARCAGRIVLFRDIGKLIFLTVRDWSGTIQLGLSKKLLGEQSPS
jgi:lysyl-tRNA synthetase class 2